MSPKKLIAVAVALAATLLLGSGPAWGQDEARIHLIHGIPETDVDVEVAGANAIEGFSFGQTEDLSALAGNTLEGVRVKLAGTDTVAIDAGDVTLPASGNVTVIAHLDADGNPTISVFENDTSTLAAGQGRITVRHTAAAPAVDVLANGQVAFAGVENGGQASVDLTAVTVTAEVVPAGATEPVVLGPSDLAIVDGTSLIVYAVGSLEDDSLMVLTESITGLGSTPTAVNTGTSPVEPDASSTVFNLALLSIVLLSSAGAVALARVRA